jgi:glycine cleavage system H protein
LPQSPSRDFLEVSVRKQIGFVIGLHNEEMDMQYSREHQWIKLQGNVATVGITQYAAGELGDLTWVTLPTVGEELATGAVLCHLEAVKAESDAYAPLGGEILEVNTVLEDQPEIINESAEASGWIAKIRVNPGEDRSHLLSKADYDQYIVEL